MTEEGQVTIAKEIRDALAIGPGWRAVQRRVADTSRSISFRRATAAP
jgi:hypothetical protein